MPNTMTREAWMAEGTRLFGPDTAHWRLKCPMCGHVATPAEWRAAGTPEAAVGISCIGRWWPGPVREAFGEGPGPCNYAGAGLFTFHNLEVDGHPVFEFEALPVTHEVATHA